MKVSLSTYISELLYLHECVIISGFGAFITNYKSAKIDNERNIISPPKSDLLFNTNLKYNDGLLVNHIARRENISLDQAESEINFFAKDLKFRLSKGEKVALHTIGVFYYDKKFNLHFEPINESNYFIDSYGFFDIKLSAGLKGNYIDTSQTIHMDQSDKRRIILRAAAVTIPVLIAVTAIQLRSRYFSNNDVNFSSLNPVENIVEQESKDAKSIPLDTAKVEKVVDEMTKPQNALFYSEESPKEEIKPVAKGNYYLIAGSFNDTKHAELLQSKLIEEGYKNSEVLSTNNGKYRVSFDVYDDKFKALQELTRIRKEKNDKSVWLFTDK